ncbi:MAG: ankyrin repeat domain-containing protein [Gammaproteobacteria bacterium]|nr:ankyrin repeat domain-containing protein [Gammaproteobacteria bacterium]
MKKALVGILIVLVVALMVYLTKPNSESIQTTNKVANDSSSVQDTAAVVKPSVTNHLVSEGKCDSEAMVKALEQLKTARDKELKALAGKVMSAEQLSQIVKRELRDYQLSQEIYTEKAKEPVAQSTEQQALAEIRKDKELMDDFMMATWAGQSQGYLTKFMAGEMAPLDANSDLHKAFMLSAISMGGEQETLNAIDKLYDQKSPLPSSALASIIQGVKSPEKLKRLLSRTQDVNQIVESNIGFFSASRTNTPLQLAVFNNNYAAAEILLELGAKPDQNKHAAAMNGFYRIDERSTTLISKMLDRGFRPSNSSSAKTLAKNLEAIDTKLSSRVANIADQLKAQEAAEVQSLPLEYRQIVEAYQAQHEPLNKQYLQCLAQENESKPKIPPYQPIDKQKIEQEIDQMVAQKVQYQQIIATLAAQNKETVEHGYRHLKRLGQEQIGHADMMNMPTEIRTLIGLLKDEKWDQLVEFMQNNQFNHNWEITPGTMIGAMIEKNAPESAIMAMAKISDKNDIKLLNQALHDDELLKRIANYGFNLDATDNYNKNLFYQAVRSNSLKQLEFLTSQGISMVSDPYGYDALDLLLRKKSANTDMLIYLSDIGFPITEDHLDYSRYLKSYYPERYQKLIAAWPNLQVEGPWQPKSQ